MFRWAALVSVIASLSTVSYTHPSVMIIPNVAIALMRSVSILELCLLGFLCLCVNALQLSYRDIAFGFGLGFGLMSANDFLQAAMIVGNSSLVAPMQYVYESVILLTLGIWVTYVAMPERVRKPGDAGQLHDLSLERNRRGPGSRNPGCSAAAGKRLLSYRCGACGREGVDAQSAGQRIKIVSNSSWIIGERGRTYPGSALSASSEICECK